MRIFKLLAVILPMIPLLGSCSLFQPSEKVIEYDEEVKLHDGSMIWVHIKRHYIKVYGALGDAGGMGSGGKAGYAPKEVEISWDTGFPNVGRKSVFFDNRVYFIEKFNNIWYVVGYGDRHSTEPLLGNSFNCRKVGLNINQDYHCQFTVDEGGHLVNQELKDIGSVKMNILNLEGINKNGNYNLDFFNNTRVSWLDKLSIQNSQDENSRFINRAYSYLIHK